MAQRAKDNSSEATREFVRSRLTDADDETVDEITGFVDAYMQDYEKEVRAFLKDTGKSKASNRNSRTRESAESSDLQEPGARHNKNDMGMLQRIHDHSVDLGASCSGMDDGDDSDDEAEAARVASIDDEMEDFREASRDLYSYDEISQMLSNSIASANTYTSIEAVYDTNFVYAEVPISMRDGATRYHYEKRKLYKRQYSINQQKVTLGDASEVVARRVYVPVSSSHQEASVDIDSITGTVRSIGSQFQSDLVEHISPTADSGVLGSILLGEGSSNTHKYVDADGNFKMRIIVPGQGSSGYYTREALERDGPKVFTKGLHMYLDHPTATEHHMRPERSVRDLIGTLTSDAKWDPDNKHGAGLYATGKVLPAMVQTLNELAQHTGVSIRGRGSGRVGVIDGRTTKIIEKLESAASVDVVTRAGAGGAILSLLESMRGSITAGSGDDAVDAVQVLKEESMSSSTQPTTGGSATGAGAASGAGTQAPAGSQQITINSAALTEVQASLAKLTEENSVLRTRLDEAQRSIARHDEARMLVEARALAEQTLAATEFTTLPIVTRSRIVSDSVASITAKVFDQAAKDAFVESVKARAASETAYLTEILSRVPQVHGMGITASAGSAGADAITSDEQTALTEAFRSLGVPNPEIASRGSWLS